MYYFCTFCPTADTRNPNTWVMAVTGPFCSLEYSILNLFLVRGCPGSGTTSIISNIKIWKTITFCHLNKITEQHSVNQPLWGPYQIRFAKLHRRSLHTIIKYWIHNKMVLTHNMMKEEDTIRQEAIKITNTNKILRF